MRPISFLLFSILLFQSCEKKDNVKQIYVPFSDIVDSSFYCTTKIDGVVHKFPYHIERHEVSVGAGEDSVRLGYSFLFNDSTKYGDESFRINISKIFKIRDLQNSVKIDSLYYYKELSKTEFLSIFEQRDYLFSTFYPDYNQCRGCVITDGASIFYETYNGTSFNTSFTAKHLSQDSIASFYNDCSFTITNIEVIDDFHIVVEGIFDVKIFGWNIIECRRFSDGYFKGIVENFL